MGLTLLAPLAMGLLALSCWAAPLHSKPQAVISFPGELVSNVTDLQLAEVSTWLACKGWDPQQGVPGVPVQTVGC